jgi:hypothetical protein
VQFISQAMKGKVIIPLFLYRARQFLKKGLAVECECNHCRRIFSLMANKEHEKEKI